MYWRNRLAIDFAASFFLGAAVNCPTIFMWIVETVLEKKRVEWRGGLPKEISKMDELRFRNDCSAGDVDRLEWNEQL